MSGSSHKVVAVNGLWAKIFASLFVALFMGAFGYAWNASAQQAVMQEKVQKLEDAKLPEKVTRLEVKLDNVDQNVNDLKQQQAAISGKIDFLVREQISNTRGESGGKRDR